MGANSFRWCGWSCWAALSPRPLRYPHQPPLDLTGADTASSKGVGRHRSSAVSIGGRALRGYLSGPTFGSVSGFVVWRVPSGYSTFEAYCGVDDRSRTEAQGSVKFQIDGIAVKSTEVSNGRAPAKISFPVNSGQSLRVNISRYGVVAEPRLLTGFTSSASSGSLQPYVAPPSPSDFVVEPRDIDNLADSLRKDVDKDPDLRSRLAESQIAIMTFDLIDIPSKSVARNVAEDLYTSMIRCGFRLVERGQSEKAIQELRIQNTGLIDPATASKIGRIGGCDLILLGSISDRGQFVVVNARLMETSTGKSAAAERVEMRKTPKPTSSSSTR